MTMDRQLIKRSAGKSTALMLAIALFILLDCSILAINVWLTQHVEQNALAINVAGRQRMLSQQMAKTLLEIKANQYETPSGETRQELNNARHLFSTTLDGFLNGGYVVDGSGIVKPFSRTLDPESSEVIHKAMSLFLPLSSSINQLQAAPSPSTIAEAARVAVEVNGPLLAAMNQLTSRMEILSQQKTQLIRRVQGAAFALALINFFVIVRMFFQRAKQSSRQLSSFLALLDNASSAMIVIDSRKRVVMANRMSQELFGYPAHLFMSIGVENLIRKTNGETIGSRRNGDTFRIDLTTRPFKFEDESLTIITVTDISKHAEEQQRLAHLANHDPLTGLVNRRAFFDRLELEVLRTRRTGRLLGVFFLDLNKFKSVNDTLGHTSGDELLKTVADRLLHVVREVDTVARFAGDEFVVMVTDVNHQHELLKIRDKIRSIFSYSFEIKGVEERIGCSLGMAIYPVEGLSATELIEIADQKMYQDKQAS